MKVLITKMTKFDVHGSDADLKAKVQREGNGRIATERALLAAAIAAIPRHLTGIKTLSACLCIQHMKVAVIIKTMKFKLMDSRSMATHPYTRQLIKKKRR
jgi:hypothetical protein